MKRWGWVVTAVIVALGGLGAFWSYAGTTSSALDEVLVYSDAEPLICSDTPTSLAGVDEFSDELTQHVLGATVSEEMNCDLRVFVENRSDFPVELTDVWLPFVGTDSGLPVRAAVIDGREPKISPELSMDPRESNVDALMHYENPVVVAPGDSYLIVTQLVYNDSGCLMGGGYMTVGGYGAANPTVTATIRGMSRELEYAGAPYAFLGSVKTSDC